MSHDDRNHIEAELERTARQLAEAQRIAHMGNWNWDIVTNDLSWSDEIYRIFGLQPQEFGASVATSWTRSSLLSQYHAIGPRTSLVQHAEISTVSRFPL